MRPMTGSPSEVCQAIGEYYRPRTPDDAIPETPVGRLLALADRLDTLVGVLSMPGLYRPGLRILSAFVVAPSA